MYPYGSYASGFSLQSYFRVPRSRGEDNSRGEAVYSIVNNLHLPLGRLDQSKIISPPGKRRCTCEVNNSIRPLHPNIHDLFVYKYVAPSQPPPSFCPACSNSSHITCYLPPPSHVQPSRSAPSMPSVLPPSLSLQRSFAVSHYYPYDQ